MSTFGREIKPTDQDANSSEAMRSFVRMVYEVVLGREPESEAVLHSYASLASPEAILSSIATSEEALARGTTATNANSPFYHYASTFDALETIRRHARPDLTADPRWLTNFLGVRIEVDYLPAVLDGKAGHVEPIPIPANWHADIAEWAAALRAVELAKDTFVVAELGCGWGCWLNNTGVAARNHGLAPTLIGVEGDDGHIAFAKRCCDINGFVTSEVMLHRGIAAARGGTALFPKQDAAGLDWGLQPIFGASEQERREVAASGRYDELPMIPLTTLIGDRPCLDLLHIDIQGGEADLVKDCVDVMSRCVAYIVIGTHSRVIEGQIISALAGGSWILEIERPAIVRLASDGPLTVVDGVQGWRNLALRPL